MDLNQEKLKDYQNLLNNFGEFRGFKKQIKLNELSKKLDSFDFAMAKSIIVDLDVPSSISLFEINDFVKYINENIDEDTQLIYYTNVNDNLKKDEIICHILMAEDKKQGV